MLNLKQKILVPGAKVFKKGRDGDAAFDIFSLSSGVIMPGYSVKIRTGIATSFSEKYVALIQDRSGTGSKGIMHQAGVIDSNYRGEWAVFLYNSGFMPFEYTPEKAVAQVVFLLLAPDEATCVVEELEDSARGEQGFGSSDKT